MMRRACSVGSVSMDAEAGLVCSVSNLSSTFQASILWDKALPCASERSSDCFGGVGFSLPIRAQARTSFLRSLRAPVFTGNRRFLFKHCPEGKPGTASQFQRRELVAVPALRRAHRSAFSRESRVCGDSEIDSKGCLSP